MSSDSALKQTAWCLQLADEAATIEFGSALASAFIELRAKQPKTSICLHLRGDLGAGKSTLARALLRALGITGKIKSPTYALVEPYDSAHGLLLHLDLYRLTEVGELEYLGVDSLFAEAALMLIEWPEKAGAMLPAPDIDLSLGYCVSHWEGPRQIGNDVDPPGRTLQMTALSVNGNLLMPKLLSFF